MRLGREFQHTYRPGKLPGHISPGHLDRVYVGLIVYNVIVDIS